MEITFLAGNWQAAYIRLRAEACKIATEMYNRELQEDKISVLEQPNSHLNKEDSKPVHDSTALEHPAMPGLMTPEEHPREAYAFCRKDDPIGFGSLVRLCSILVFLHI